MSTISEVESAVRTIELAGNQDIALLHCVSNYPASPLDVNLRAMATMTHAFGYTVGYSDHTNGLEIAFAAVALGAKIIEKHFTLDRNLPGPDHRASLEPTDLCNLISGIRNIELALGDGRKRQMPSEKNTADVARKSLIAAKDIQIGTRLSLDHVTIKRPGTGLSPAVLGHVIGRITKVYVAAGSILTMDMLS